MRSRLHLCVFCAHLACGPAVEVPGEDGGTAGATTSTSETSPLPGTSTSTGVPPSSTTTASTVDPDSGSGSSDGGHVDFIVPTDTVLCHCECDVWAQDCPRGHKCNPWANDGGVVWNATRCVPVDADPGAPGDPCTVEDNAATGFDSCEAGAMCWRVDPDTLTGECVGFCTGDHLDPQCPPSTTCLIANDGVLVLCLPTCDPILGDCQEGEQCIPQAEDGSFICVVTGAEPRAGYGDPCEYVTSCDDGLTCVSSMQLQGIGACSPDVPSCCTAYCDLGAADPDAACPDQALGQACEPYYEPGETPPGFENLGVCVISV
jgi:hypothetical protein